MADWGDSHQLTTTHDNRHVWFTDGGDTRYHNHFRHYGNGGYVVDAVATAPSYEIITYKSIDSHHHDHHHHHSSHDKHNHHHHHHSPDGYYDDKNALLSATGDYIARRIVPQLQHGSPSRPVALLINYGSLVLPDDILSHRLMSGSNAVLFNAPGSTMTLTPFASPPVPVPTPTRYTEPRYYTSHYDGTAAYNTHVTTTAAIEEGPAPLPSHSYHHHRPPKL
jgi:hypothetical protein